MHRRKLLHLTALSLTIPYFGIPKNTFSITKCLEHFYISKDGIKLKINICDAKSYDVIDTHNICMISDLFCIARQEIEFDLKSLSQVRGLSFPSREDFRKTKLTNQDNERILCFYSYHMNKHKCCNSERRTQFNKMLKEKFPQDLELYRC